MLAVNQVVCGDYLDVEVEPGSVQLIVTSPPYPRQRGCQLTVPEWLGWFKACLGKMVWELAEDGVIALNVQFKRRRDGRYDSRLFTELLALVESPPFSLYLADICSWDKLNPAPSGPHNRNLIPAWEPVFVLAKSADYAWYPDAARKPYAPASLAKLLPGRKARANGVNGGYNGGHRRAHPNGALQHNVLRVSPSGGPPRPRGKGGSFPLALPWDFILLHTRPGQVVMDPFCGAGTTLKAAELLGRCWLGVEKDEEEAEVAREWLRERQPALPMEGLTYNE
jgi:DNA modification methylase